MNGLKMIRGVACALILVVTSGTVSAAGWVDDWFDESTVTPSGHLETQKRGYYTGGSFQGRLRMTNDYLVTVQPPSIKAGCGGVDMFLGGMSYLDGEYIVEKFENILAGVPAFAFEIGMQEFCKPCSSAMQTMTEITDYLNSMQVNDCRLAQRIATSAVKGDTSLYDDAKAKAAQGLALFSGVSKNATDFDNTTSSDGGKSNVDTRELVASCPAVFKTVFTDGSVVGNVADLVGLDQYAALMRGLLGDVNVAWSNADKVYKTVIVEPCPGNDGMSAFDLITGKMETMSTPGNCTNAGMTAVASIVEDRLDSISSKLSAAGGMLSADDTAFIEAAPIPLLAALRDAVMRGNVDETIGALRDPLATAYAFRILDDLHKAARLVLVKADEVGRTAAGARTCDTTFLRGAIDQISFMDEAALKYRELARQAYGQQRDDLMANTAQAQQLLELRRQALQRRESLNK